MNDSIAKAIIGFGICSAVASAVIVTGDGDYLWALLALVLIL